MLQWGRGFSAAERRGDGRPYRNLIGLQWGRGFSAAKRANRVGYSDVLEPSGVTAPELNKLKIFNSTYIYETHIALLFIS